MDDDHIVKFNHDYSKLRGQRSGFLCYATIYHVGDKFPDEAYQYDTDGEWEFKPNTDYIQLVFLGDKEIPFPHPVLRYLHGGKIGIRAEGTLVELFRGAAQKREHPRRQSVPFPDGVQKAAEDEISFKGAEITLYVFELFG